MIFKDYKAFDGSGFKPTVCIIGSGPAGMSLALKLEKQNIPSLIIEAGDLEYTAKSQDAYKGKVIGDEYPKLDTARLRYFGGTSNHWGGLCRPLDDIDFEVRDGFKNSGWPITKKDLSLYSKEAESILEIDAFPEDMQITDDLHEITFRTSKNKHGNRLSFGEKYLEHVKRSKLISVLINSPVKSLVPSNKKITHVNIASSKNKSQNIYAEYFCLCTGGIENSRMLLWSNELHNGKVVPHKSALGKYWMEHPHYDVGQSLFYRPSTLTDERNTLVRFFAPSAKFLRENAIGNFACRIYRPTNGFKEGLTADAICTAANLVNKFKDNPVEPGRCIQDIKASWGQLPVSANRIELSNEKDALGIPRVNLYWKKQPIDKLTAQIAAKAFGAYLIGKDIGRLKLASWLADGQDYPSDDEKIGYHHMGGTRMATSYENGVVDANCKVFDMDNLFIGGSSVFPTGGHANPTYTIVQLALRLGTHISSLEQKA